MLWLFIYVSKLYLNEVTVNNRSEYLIHALLIRNLWISFAPNEQYDAQ